MSPPKDTNETDRYGITLVLSKLDSFGLITDSTRIISIMSFEIGGRQSRRLGENRLENQEKIHDCVESWFGKSRNLSWQSRLSGLERSSAMKYAMEKQRQIFKRSVDFFYEKNASLSLPRRNDLVSCHQFTDSRRALNANYRRTCESIRGAFAARRLSNNDSEQTRRNAQLFCATN